MLTASKVSKGNSLMNSLFNLSDQSQLTWLERAELCLDLIRSIDDLPKRATLADVGCGDKKLEIALRNAHLDLRYSGFDLHPQSMDVQMLDITCNALPGYYDVAVLLGLTEYLPDLTGTLASLQSHCRYLVLSHVVADISAYTPEDLQRLGWLNHKTEAEITELLARTGYLCLRNAVSADRRTVLWLSRTLKNDES